VGVVCEFVCGNLWELCVSLCVHQQEGSRPHFTCAGRVAARASWSSRLLEASDAGTLKPQMLSPPLTLVALTLVPFVEGRDADSDSPWKQRSNGTCKQDARLAVMCSKHLACLLACLLVFTTGSRPIPGTDLCNTTPHLPLASPSLGDRMVECWLSEYQLTLL
jgi:hypothetical protein